MAPVVRMGGRIHLMRERGGENRNMSFRLSHRIEMVLQKKTDYLLSS